MSRTNLPAPPSMPPPALVNGRVCAYCSKLMRLVTVEPHPRHLNIDVHNYGCDCGHNEDFFVAHKD